MHVVVFEGLHERRTSLRRQRIRRRGTTRVLDAASVFFLREHTSRRELPSGRNKQRDQTVDTHPAQTPIVAVMSLCRPLSFQKTDQAPNSIGKSTSARPKCDSWNAGLGGSSGSRFTNTVRAPAYSADRTKFDAGLTVPDVPMATKRSQSLSALLDSHSGFAGIGSSNKKRPLGCCTPTLPSPNLAKRLDNPSVLSGNLTTYNSFRLRPALSVYAK